MHIRRRTGAIVVGAVGAAALIAGTAAAALPAGARAHHRVSSASHGPGWISSWAASPQSGSTTSFERQTVRNVVYTSAGGGRVRIRLSNEFGTRPAPIGAGRVAIVRNGAQLVAGTQERMTFGGRASTTIPVGGHMVSDPIRLDVPAHTKLAVDLYLAGATGPASYHALAWGTNYVAPGNRAGQVSARDFSGRTSSWFYLSGVDVRDTPARRTVVAFGDSITDVGHSQVDGNGRWPEYLSRRLTERLGKTAPSVVNAGISGNRMLRDSTCNGRSALHRFERDALAQPGVDAVILLEGINDIGFSGAPDTGCFAPNNATVTAGDIVAGYRKLIALAHAHGVRIYGATLTPFGGSHCVYDGAYGTERGERLRQQVNHWIRTTHAFDGVVDFDRATAGRYDARSLDPAYNSTGGAHCPTGDSLHPNDPGDQAMADAVPVRWFRR